MSDKPIRGDCIAKRTLIRAFLAAFLLFCVLITVFLIYSFVRSGQPDPFDYLNSEWVSEDENMLFKTGGSAETWYMGSIICSTDEGEKEYGFRKYSYDNVMTMNGRIWNLVWCTEKFCIYNTTITDISASTASVKFQQTLIGLCRMKGA